jgi:hypothetical protein
MKNGLMHLARKWKGYTALQIVERQEQGAGCRGSRNVEVMLE